MPDDGPPGSGGVPTPGPGNLWWTPQNKRNIEQTMRAYRQGLSGFERSQRAVSSAIPPMSASISGLMRDYLAHAVGLLRFGANVYGFEFTPSISIIARDLRNLQNGLTNYKTPLEQAVKEVLIPSIEQNFAEGGRPPWEPLDQATVDKHRSKIGMGATPILVRTGLLYRVATNFNIWTINQTSAVIKELPSIVWYGNVHQQGLSEGATGSKSWFKAYQVRAQNALGPHVTSQKKIDAKAWQIFDEHVAMGGMRGQKGKMNIPQRRFIVWQEEDFVKVQAIFYDWMDDVIVRRGRFIPGMPL